MPKSAAENWGSYCLPHPYINEHRILCKDGHWKWVLSRGLLISRDAQGEPLRMIGTHTDIDYLKIDQSFVRHLMTGSTNLRLPDPYA